MLTNWNRILIIKLRAIGDVILTTPVFENLRNSFPNSQIDFIVEKPSASLVAEDKNINSILIAPSGKDRKFKNDWQFFRKIRKQKYDVCIDLFGNPRSAIITLFSNAKLRVGYSYRGRKYAYQEKFSSNVSQIHEVEFNLDAVRHFDIPIVTKQPKIYLRDLDLKTAQKIIDGLNYSDKSIIALNPFASWVGGLSHAKGIPPDTDLDVTGSFTLVNHEGTCIGGAYDSATFINYFTGEIAEIILYHRALSGTDVENVAQYLKAKYDYGETIPDAIPYVPLTDCRAVQAAGGQASDFDGNCTVNLSDFAFIADRWLYSYDPM